MTKMNRGERGQSLIEFAFILPLVLLLVINAVNFGSYLYAGVTVTNAARAGVEYNIMDSAMAGAPITPTNAQIAAVVANDIISLPNSSSLQVRVCTNKKNVETCTCVVGACTGMGATPTDPENPTNADPALYILSAVDVTYTYEPMIPLWSFPGLGIHATIPATTMHRKAVMRRLQ